MTSWQKLMWKHRFQEAAIIVGSSGLAWAILCLVNRAMEWRIPPILLLPFAALAGLIVHGLFLAVIYRRIRSEQELSEMKTVPFELSGASM
jgi:hypothetical protein